MYRSKIRISIRECRFLVHTSICSRGLLCKCTVLRGQPVYNVPATDLYLKIDSRPLSVHPLPGAGVLLFRFFVSRGLLPTYERTVWSGFILSMNFYKNCAHLKVSLNWYTLNEGNNKLSTRIITKYYWHFLRNSWLLHWYVSCW